MVTVQSQTTTEDNVTYSAPGQILSGGDLSINGSLNNDKSQIAAGGDFNGTGPQTINADALGTKQTIAQGTMTASTAQGGGRQWTSDQPYSKTLDNEVVNLSILPATPTVAPGTVRSVPIASASAPGAGGSVSVAQGTAQGASLSGVGNASGIDGVNVAAGTAGKINAPGSATVNAPKAGTLSTPNAGTTAATSASAGATASLGVEVIRTMTPPLRLPNNALYHTESDPGSHYLIETDPAYANFKTWISSDSMITALNQSPDNVMKRIGDGFYEQQLVAQQVLSLTGQRFVGDYTSNESEYEVLLNGGVHAALAFNLTIGAALTDAQMAALTTDIVWLVKQTVTLADGSTQDVLTPQVYLHARDMDVTGTGALISGRNVSIQNGGDVNNSGTIASRGVTIVTGDNINNVNGTLAGSTLIAHANTDLTNLAGKIVADNALLTAGRDINISSQSWSATGLNTATSGLGALSTINTGNLAIGAGHDLTITASALNATGTKGRRRTLLTSLTDSRRFKPSEIEAVYRRRCQTETSYMELKTTMLGVALTLRSETVECVYQEIWGALIAYNLIRISTTRIARKSTLNPLKFSFIRSFYAMQLAFLGIASAGMTDDTPVELIRLGKRIA